MAQSLSHSKWLCKYHIVFIPKYRRKAIYYQLRADIKKIIKDLCKWKGIEIIEGHMMADPYTLTFINTTKIQCIANYRIFKRKKRLKDMQI